MWAVLLRKGRGQNIKKFISLLHAPLVRNWLINIDFSISLYMKAGVRRAVGLVNKKISPHPCTNVGMFGPN